MGPTEALRCIARARVERRSQVWRDACDRCALEVIDTRPAHVERTYLKHTYDTFVEREQTELARLEELAR